METKCILSFIWIPIFLPGTLGYSVDSSGLQYYNTNSDPCPNECDPKKCSKLSYCNSKIEKDRCNCCDVCASDVWSPDSYRPPLKKGGACEQVKCPKRKVCVENMQGLPLCTCPNAFICRGRKRQVCGMDGNTYKSKCHMRVASCAKGKRIKLKHKGACNTGMIATQQYGGKVKYPDGEYDIRRRRKKNRKKEKRKHRRHKLRLRRKRKQKKRAYLRGRKQTSWRYGNKEKNKLNKRKNKKRNRRNKRVLVKN
ncbi:hypothetical protein FSP39_011312 [Pinctada imbricata]|uniref:Kazal-like domain-containing protein n=1 Tax=Pinctada imbricata TaxID=66713 RepID=A0AA88Y3N3_PINIB|nr:hypothetical protein FSP39_011312 [Pinctada imbricata]